jgi:hypothetical protein
MLTARALQVTIQPGAQAWHLRAASIPAIRTLVDNNSWNFRYKIEDDEEGYVA